MLICLMVKEFCLLIIWFVCEGFGDVYVFFIWYEGWISVCFLSYELFVWFWVGWIVVRGLVGGFGLIIWLCCCGILKLLLDLNWVRWGFGSFCWLILLWDNFNKLMVCSWWLDCGVVKFVRWFVGYWLYIFVMF